MRQCEYEITPAHSATNKRAFVSLRELKRRDANSKKCLLAAGTPADAYRKNTLLNMYSRLMKRVVSYFWLGGDAIMIRRR